MAFSKHQDLDLQERIGRGGFGTVYRALWNGSEVAAKRLFEPDKHEVNVLSKLKHPNIVKLLAVKEDNVDLYLILEYCKGGSLRSYLDKLKAKGERLSIRQVLDLALQAAKPIKYLRDVDIIHKDIKSDNYLIDGNILKLSDFGLAKITDKTIQNVSLRGSVRFMTIELIRDKILSLSYDIYSYGVVVWELWTTNLPFEGLDDIAQIIYAIGENSEKPQIPPDCPKELADLMNKCWSTPRDERPSIDEILQILSSLITSAEEKSSKQEQIIVEHAGPSTVLAEASNQRLPVASLSKHARPATVVGKTLKRPFEHAGPSPAITSAEEKSSKQGQILVEHAGPSTVPAEASNQQLPVASLSKQARPATVVGKTSNRPFENAGPSPAITSTEEKSSKQEQILVGHAGPSTVPAEASNQRLPVASLSKHPRPATVVGKTSNRPFEHAGPSPGVFKGLKQHINFAGTLKLVNAFGDRDGPGKLLHARDIAVNYITGDVAVIVYNNSEVKVYSSVGVYKHSLDTTQGLTSNQESHPWNITVNSKGCYYVTNFTQHVKVYNPAGTYKHTIVSPEDTPSDEENTILSGLAMDDKDQLLVGVVESCGSHKYYISRHRPDGTHIASINVERQPDYLAATSQDTVIVSSWYGVHIIKFNTGELLHNIKPHITNEELWQPRGVCCHDNIIYICDYGNNQICCFSVSGEYLGSIATGDHPAGITFNKESNRLLVACINKVEVYAMH